jgi:uncharacterized membrane protein YgaE (UPF0421/DUF939 family)
MMIGLLTGIAIGEILLLLPIFSLALRISTIAFAAMMVALSFGLAPVIPIQAGVSAILVIAMGPVTAGTPRLMDAATGAGVALLFSQILLTPDPLRLIDAAAAEMLRLLAQGFAEDAEAVAERNEQKAQRALQHFFGMRDSLSALVAGIAAARSSMQWSLRGRLAADDVRERASRYDRRAIRLYASTLLFGEALANALRRTYTPPSWMQMRLERVARLCRELAASRTLPDAEQPIPMDVPAEWRSCVEHLRAVEHALNAFQSTSMTSQPPAGLPTRG